MNDQNLTQGSRHCGHIEHLSAHFLCPQNVQTPHPLNLLLDLKMFIGSKQIEQLYPCISQMYLSGRKSRLLISNKLINLLLLRKSIYTI